MVKLIDNYCIDEFTEKDNLSVRYLTGILVKKYQKITSKPTEFANVKWYNVSDAVNFEKLKKPADNF